ncbi:MAG: glucose-6-phosphate isomerase [Alphaproteobacteria bacterium]
MAGSVGGTGTGAGGALEAAWGVVEREGTRLRRVHLRALFSEDVARGEHFLGCFEDLQFDFSREKLSREALRGLLALAAAGGVEEKRDAMFSGAGVNTTEGRAVLHTALRDGRFAPKAIQEEVELSLERFLSFAEGVRSGSLVASDGTRFEGVIHIGMGGSDLGVKMAVRALSPDADGPRIHFVSNVDGAALADVLRKCDAARSLVVVSSKTFTTEETLRNAYSAREWLIQQLGEGEGGWQTHMAAVSVASGRVREFGISDERCFGYGEWVGGRYSLWSAAGLGLALAIGREGFLQFLRGAAAMDSHFCSAPLAENLPVLFALVALWRRNVMGWPMVALVPYDERLGDFPDYVQQLEMESNGKSVCEDGSPVRRATSPIVWGGCGTGVQHAFFQLLHQGTDIVPVDMILARYARSGLEGHHEILQAHCLAQARALAFGRSEEEVRAAMIASGMPAEEALRLAPHRRLQGDRPSSILLHDRLDAYRLGRLVALFEHKVFVAGCIWGINSFDQWGVELGKEIASGLLPHLRGEEGRGEEGAAFELDAGTRRLLDAVRSG